MAQVLSVNDITWKLLIILILHVCSIYDAAILNVHNVIIIKIYFIYPLGRGTGAQTTDPGVDGQLLYQLRHCHPEICCFCPSWKRDPHSDALPEGLWCK